MKWLKHDTDANMDAKLQEVLLDYGLEGYGLYWYCIELIGAKIDANNVSFSLEHDARLIARNTGCTPKKVSEMMSKFIALGLFQNVDGLITCMSIAKRLDKSMTSNREMREIIESIRNSHDLVMTQSPKPMQEEKRREENKTIDRSPAKITKKKTLSDEDQILFDDFWNKYPRKTAKPNALKAFKKLKDKPSVINLILEDIRRRLLFDEWSLSNKQFIPHPATYLNGERWKDEIISPPPADDFNDSGPEIFE